MSDNELAIRRTYLAACAGILGFATVFFLLQLLRMPLFWYHPLDRLFRFETRPSGLAMDFYGRTLWASLGGILGYWGGGHLAPHLKLDRDRAWLWMAYGLGMIALAMCLIGYQIWPRPAAPIPLPSWYVPQ